MRRIVNSTYITLDGVIEAPQDWPSNGIESDGTSGQVQSDLLMSCDAVLLGRRTYEGFAPVWTSMSGNPLADRMNTIEKYVVSTTLRDPQWQNTTVINGDALNRIAALKAQPGKDIVQYGFGPLAHSLLEHGLLDELRLWVYPMILGRGVAADLLFRPGPTTQLELTDTLVLNTGIVILTYRRG